MLLTNSRERAVLAKLAGSKEKKAGKAKTILVEGLKGAGLGAAVGTTGVGVRRALEIRKSFAKQLKKLEDEGHVERAAKLRDWGDKNPIEGVALKEGLVGGGVPGALLGGAVGLTRGIKKVKSQQRAELQQIAEVLRGESLSKKRKLLTALGVGGGLTAGLATGAALGRVTAGKEKRAAIPAPASGSGIAPKMGASSRWPSRRVDDITGVPVGKKMFLGRSSPAWKRALKGPMSFRKRLDLGKGRQAGEMTRTTPGNYFNPGGPTLPRSMKSGMGRGAYGFGVVPKPLARKGLGQFWNALRATFRSPFR